MMVYIPSREEIERYMHIALEEARLALEEDEVPVGCVFVSYTAASNGMNNNNNTNSSTDNSTRSNNNNNNRSSRGVMVAKGRNKTNMYRDATRHAELEAIDSILSNRTNTRTHNTHNTQSTTSNPNPNINNPNINNPNNHIYDDDDGLLLKDVILYVTVEPCIMCASALRELGVSSVYFGCGNERFGGNGGVFAINWDMWVITDRTNEVSISSKSSIIKSSISIKSSIIKSSISIKSSTTTNDIIHTSNTTHTNTTTNTDINDTSPISISNIPSPNSTYIPPYTSEGGHLRSEAIMLLRRFYMRENVRAPVPKCKKNRVLKTGID